MGQPCCLEGKSPPRLPLIGLLSLFILPSQRDLPRSDYWWLPTAPNFEVLGHLPGCCIWWVSNVESVLCCVLFCSQTPLQTMTPSLAELWVRKSSTHEPLWVSQTWFHIITGVRGNCGHRRMGLSAHSVGFSLQFENWEALVLKRILCSRQRPVWDCPVTSNGIVAFWIDWAERDLYVELAGGGNWENPMRKRKIHTGEEKRLKIQREERKKEVKLMFGQMKKDGWGLMEWAK